MSENELTLAVLSIIFGTGLTIVLITQIVGLIKSYLNRNKGGVDTEVTEQLIEDYLHFKKETQERLNKVEGKSGTSTSQRINSSDQQPSIQEEMSGEEKRLKNMLRQDRK